MHVVCPRCLAVNRVPAERAGQAPKCGKCGEGLLRGEPIELSAASFDRYVEKNELPVLVDFWASWCGPCKMMAPVFAQVARDFASRASFAKVSTEQYPDLAQRFAVRSIPTLALFRSGREVDRVAGAMDAGSLRAWLTRHLS